jgi:hypothetical protein
MSANQKLSPLLVSAKDEYIAQLADSMAPFLINVVNTLYMAAKKNAGFGKPTKEFQMKLREIPLWNQSMIDAQVTAIENKYKYFPELVAAAFVSYVKILSSVKIHSHKPHIQLKLPADDVFVHKVFVNTAKTFYLDPALVKAPREVRLAIVKNAVETSVRELLPTEDILRAYLGGSVDAEGIQTDEIDGEEIDLSPSPEDVVENASPADSVSSSLSPVQALGDPAISPSPVPSAIVPTAIPTAEESARAVEQLKSLMQQTAPAPVPLSQPQQLSPSPMPQQQAYQPQPQIIQVPKANPYAGAFVSPAPPRNLGFDASGSEFFS